MVKICRFLLLLRMEENVFFEEVRNDEMHEQSQSAVLVSPVEGNYIDLYEELLEKCDPTNFLNPYDPEKAGKANIIYNELRSANRNDKDLMKHFRTQAIEDLGVKFSTRKLYNRLTKICNPQNFTGESYNSQLFEKANNIYPLVLENADNIIRLEEIWQKAQELKTYYDTLKSAGLVSASSPSTNSIAPQGEAEDDSFAKITIFVVIIIFFIAFLISISQS